MSLQHCSACGTLTDRGQCDCTKDDRMPQFTVFSLADFRSTIKAHEAAIIEECARVAEGFTCGICGMDGKAATAIRALKDKGI